MKPFCVKPGDRVGYSVSFLKSIGMSHSDMAHEKGTVKEVKDFANMSLATIEWDGNQELPNKVAVPNLALVGPNPRYCQC